MTFKMENYMVPKNKNLKKVSRTAIHFQSLVDPSKKWKMVGEREIGNHKMID